MGGSDINEDIGDPDAVPAMADRVRPAVVSWDEAPPSPVLPLDELVPWWRPVVATLGVAIDGGRAAGPVRVGRDAAGRARLVEPAGGGPVLVAASPQDLDDDPGPGGPPDEAVWAVAVAGPDGGQREVHGVFRLGDEARMWTATTAAGAFMALVLDGLAERTGGAGRAEPAGSVPRSTDATAASGPGASGHDADAPHPRGGAAGTIVAVVREADLGAEPDPDVPVDAVLRVAGDIAVPVERRLTVGDLERGMEALVAEIADRVAGPEVEFDGAIGAAVDAGGWLAAFESAHRRASEELTARATAVADAWATLPPPPSVVVVRPAPDGAAAVRAAPGGATSDWTVYARTRTKDVVRRRLFRPTAVDVEGRISSTPVTPWTRSDDGDQPWRTLRGLMAAPPRPDERPGRGTDPTAARIARATEAFARLELDVVGAINRATAAAGRETVVLVVGPDGRPAPDVDRWWPADVRPDVRRRLT